MITGSGYLSSAGLLVLLQVSSVTLVVMTSDSLRAGEQQDNAAVVAGLPAMFTSGNWHDRNELRDSVLRALEVAARGVRSTGRLGNDSAVAFVCELACAAGLPTRGAVL